MCGQMGKIKNDLASRNLNITDISNDFRYLRFDSTKRPNKIIKLREKKKRTNIVISNFLQRREVDFYLL
jgi:hypothetical protein